jgi:CheY-like chemotaxis protein/anti-sigma regulatory factor (Ser/Thr protein kinase)
MAHSTSASTIMIDAEYLAEVLHELRSPLGGVDAMAELLSATALTADQKRLVEGLRAASAHLRAIADDVLDAAAISNGSFKWKDAPVDLRALITPIAIASEARAAAKGLWFHVQCEDSLPKDIITDARCIRQMIENLLDNAIKITTAGQITLSVEQVGMRGSYIGLRFSVTDTGPGFSEMERKQLFRPFTRLDNGITGTGLGLSMVSRLAKSMGGEVGCESVPGKGACFWFSIRVKRQGTGDGSVVSEPGITETFEPEENRRILVVDDNHASRQIMQVMLEHFGFQAVQAESGEAALAMLAQDSYAAVMLDQTLPGLSGLETLKAIRSAKKRWASTPVVPVTGRVSAADRNAFLWAGSNGFVEKPVTAASVRNALQAALGQGDHHKEAAAQSAA